MEISRYCIGNAGSQLWTLMFTISVNYLDKGMNNEVLKYCRRIPRHWVTNVNFHVMKCKMTISTYIRNHKLSCFLQPGKLLVVLQFSESVQCSAVIKKLHKNCWRGTWKEKKKKKLLLWESELHFHIVQWYNTAFCFKRGSAGSTEKASKNRWSHRQVSLQQEFCFL